MTTQPSIDQIIERAQRVQEDRIAAIRDLAQTRQEHTDVRAECDRDLAELHAKIAQRVGESERDDLRAFNAALAAGWSVDELKKVGFNELAKKTRARRRTIPKTAPSRGANAPANSPAGPSSEAAQGADGGDHQEHRQQG